MRSLLLLFAIVVAAHAENPWNLEKLSQPPKADWGATNELTQEVWYDGALRALASPCRPPIRHSARAIR